MSTPDFSKIFAQNATSIQEWLDATRLIGWGSLGQELPPYELFDALQRNTDLKMKWLYDNSAKTTDLGVYVKDLTSSDATITATKGDGTKKTVTVDNVTNSGYSQRLKSIGLYIAPADGSLWDSGNITFGKVYNNGYPCLYGNVMNIGGEGWGQLALGWSSTDRGIERMYYRSARDATKLWSAWRTIAYTTDLNDYVKDLTAVNDTITATKGDGTKKTVTVDNVTSATKATQDKNGNDITTTYLPLTGGTLTGDITTKGYIITAKSLDGVTTNFAAPPSLGCNFSGGKSELDIIQGSAGNRTRIASFIAKDSNGTMSTVAYISNTGEYYGRIASSATATTQASGDNSTKVATTAFVQSLISTNGGGIVAQSYSNGSGYVKFANGLTIQMGRLTVTHSATYSFPLTFSLICTAFGGKTQFNQGAVDGNSAGIYAINNSQYVAYADDNVANVDWIAIGVVN